jgi:hypothetical protein
VVVEPDPQKVQIVDFLLPLQVPAQHGQPVVVVPHRVEMVTAPVVRVVLVEVVREMVGQETQELVVVVTKEVIHPRKATVVDLDRSLEHSVEVEPVAVVAQVVWVEMHMDQRLISVATAA